jgi:hypothetical protein
MAVTADTSSAPAVRPFTVEISAAGIDELRARIAATRFPEHGSGAPGPRAPIDVEQTNMAWWINGQFYGSGNGQVRCDESAQSDLSAHDRRAVTFGLYALAPAAGGVLLCP